MIIIPIKTSKDDPKPIQEKGEKIFADLKKIGVRVNFDDTELHTPGWKYAQWELKGVPIRIEYGVKDLSKNQEKFPVKLEEVTATVIKYLDIIQKRMFDKIKKQIDEKRTHATDFDSFFTGLILVIWCSLPGAMMLNVKMT